MNRLSSFIFSSKPPGPVRWRGLLYVGLWIVIGLVTIDVLINVVFAYPSDPKNLNPGRMQSYFEYGRSTEGKLQRMTRVDPAETAPITLSGWYSPLVSDQSKPDSDAPIVTFYGMSHSVQLAHALGRVTDRYTPRTVGAPGASGNWAYGAFLRDRGGGKSRVVVLALMSANLPMITTVSAMNWNGDFPMPYTSDRFYLNDDGLGVVHPPFASFNEYTDAFFDPAKWEAARQMMAKYDSQYDSFMLRSTILDRSALVRLVRRAYGQRLARDERSKVLDRSGYREHSEQIELARVIVRKFAETARADGMIPVIYLVNNLGYSDQLFRALESTLAANKIPYLSSHTVASPGDPRKYVPNSHFTDAVDEEMARALIKVIEGQTKISSVNEPG